jgi:L-amino acid N-acyltransferase YncA
MLTIRKATGADYDQVWEIYSAVIETGDTYVFDPETPRSDLAKHWFAKSMTTFAA